MPDRFSNPHAIGTSPSLLWARTWQKQGRIQFIRPPLGLILPASFTQPFLRRNRPLAAAPRPDGTARGPGWRPPANFTSAWIRASTEGWVANRSENPSRGLSTHNSMIAEVARGSSPRFSILRSAEIMASGFFVSSTDPASAKSSRDRDSASRTSCDNSQASAISATAIIMTKIAAPPPELFRSLPEEDEEESDEDDHDEPPPELQLPPALQPKLVKLLNNSSAKKPTTPAMITAITIICTSPLRTWVSSWPSTAPIS